MSRTSNCVHCGKEFFRFSRVAQKYCSPRCRERFWYKQKTGHALDSPKYVLACGQCGKEVRTNDARKKYCSQRCNFAFQNAKRGTTKFQKRTCPVCASEFQPMQKRGVGKTYCSESCRAKACYDRNKPRLSEKSWEYKIRNKWGGNWWAALQRDQFTCQMCSMKSFPSQWKGKRKLVVHHKDGTGEHEEKNHNVENLLTLCDPCHRMFHTGVNLIWRDGGYVVTGEIFGKLQLNSVPVADK